jgi:hypothetical protein
MGLLQKKSQYKVKLIGPGPIFAVAATVPTFIAMARGILFTASVVQLEPIRDAYLVEV